MGMIPELAVAVLACARIGAVHSVIFGGFSAESIADRVLDAQATALITCDGAFRGAKTIPLKSVVDEALASCPEVHTVVVHQRTQEPVDMREGRDVWYHEALPADPKPFPAVEMDAEDLLFILYTSGSTGKPKGVVHTCGGYGLGDLHLCQRFPVPAGPNSLLHGRHRLDYRAQLHRLWALVRRCDDGAV